ncbi:hypothetical protein [Parabacteroides sp.]
MLQLKRNDLLIGFTISVLLSIFVNFALLMRKYEFETGNPGMGIQPPDRTMYYLLIWFFVFSFILFIVNSLMYKLGDKLFRRKEYKRVLVVCVTCISIAYGMFHLSPVLYTAIVVEWIPNSFMTEHLLVFLTVMLSSILIRLLGSKQQMKLEYEQLKTEKLQNSYNALMGQINPHFFFNSLNEFIISRNAIKDIDLWFGSRLSVNLTLPVPERIIISKTKTPIFKKWILREEE